MLRRAWRGSLMAAALLLAACSPAERQAIEPISIEATYRLTFNDALVGNSLFVLDIGADGSYRIEAFTTPAGEMRQAEGHEVLETSHGRISTDQVLPQRFEKSTMADEQIQIDRLQFDWDSRLQHRSSAQGGHTDALLPGTQDRLSYLLTAWQLAIAGQGEVPVRIVSPEETDETQLQVAGKEEIDVPLGHYSSVAIRRRTAEPNVIRALWFDTELGPLPLRVVRGWTGNTVDMQLQSLSRRPDHPH